VKKIYGLFGVSGSGKSTFCDFIKSQSHDITIISQDWFYRDDLDSKTNFDDPISLDINAILSVFKEIFDGKNLIRVPIYDFETHTRKGFRLISCGDFIIFEGHMFPLINEVKKNMSALFFYSTSLDLALVRRIKRDTSERGRSISSVCEQYLDSVRPTAIKIHSMAEIADYIIDDNHSESFSRLKSAGLFRVF
jgi:uridine kinase